MTKFKRFVHADEAAAVTVDWVVLTAVLALLGSTMVSIATNGMFGLSTRISTELSAMSS
jgi:hypothetical protein